VTGAVSGWVKRRCTYSIIGAVSGIPLPLAARRIAEERGTCGALLIQSGDE
jgi:hypothetical protein